MKAPATSTVRTMPNASHGELLRRDGRYGIHLAGRFGVRIEDIVTVTEGGGRRLNNTCHELRTVR